MALEAARAGIPEVVVAGKARLIGAFTGTRITTGEEMSKRIDSARPTTRIRRGRP
jgi:hypothetical protein